MLTREGKNLPLTEITAENYLVDERERGFYHCKMERKLFDGALGVRLSRPFIQKFERKGFDGLYRNLVESGYDIVILHDPTKAEQPKAEPRLKAEPEPVEVSQPEAIDVPAGVFDLGAEETPKEQPKEVKGGKPRKKEE